VSLVSVAAMTSLVKDFQRRGMCWVSSEGSGRGMMVQIQNKGF